MRPAALPAFGSCDHCRRRHPRPNARWACRSCGEVLCAGQIFDGRGFGRKGDVLHVHEVRVAGKRGFTLRPCGAAAEIGP